MFIWQGGDSLFPSYGIVILRMWHSSWCSISMVFSCGISSHLHILRIWHFSMEFFSLLWYLHTSIHSSMLYCIFTQECGISPWPLRLFYALFHVVLHFHTRMLHYYMAFLPFHGIFGTLFTLPCCMVLSRCHYWCSSNNFRDVLKCFYSLFHVEVLERLSKGVPLCEHFSSESCISRHILLLLKTHRTCVNIFLLNCVFWDTFRFCRKRIEHGVHCSIHCSMVFISEL